MGIQSVEIKNFKSIRDSGKIELGKINVLIGPNGAGKSNFIGFFKFLREVIGRGAQLYISRHGRAEGFLYFGKKQSASLGGTLIFDSPELNQYSFEMIHNHEDRLVFERELFGRITGEGQTQWSSGELHSRFTREFSPETEAIETAIESLRLYHFNDTSYTAPMKYPCNLRDYSELREDGGNLAAFLYRLMMASPVIFRRLEHAVRMIAPFFDRFVLEPDEINPDQIALHWREIDSEIIFNAHSLSDGTLRMICLAALLMQPKPPATVIIDEPELGLHPSAITHLAAMVRSASHLTQIILSTQSTELLDEFNAEDVIVVERKDHQTVFKRLSEDKLAEWLSEYSLGQLWNMNVIGGKP
jgi:predicted ATPase